MVKVNVSIQKMLFLTFHLMCFQKMTILSKGLNFSLPNKKVEISEYLSPFELLYHEVGDFSKDSSDKELLKS